MGKAAIPGAKRTNLHMVKPEDLSLVWDDSDSRFADSKLFNEILSEADSLDGENHPLWDEKIFIPIRDAHVKSVMRKGVIIPIVVRRNGETIEVVDGRQRVKWARAANIQLEAEGEPPIRVGCTIKRGDEADALVTMIATNEIRTADEIINKAKKAVRLMERGYDEEEAAEVFDVTVTTIKNWQKLLELSPRVQKACRVGQVTVTEAIKWHKSDHDEQNELLKVHVVSEKKRTSDPYKNKNGKTRKKASRIRAPSRTEVRALIEALPESKTKAALQWAVGDISTRKAKESVKELNDL